MTGIRSFPQVITQENDKLKFRTDCHHSQGGYENVPGSANLRSRRRLPALSITGLVAAFLALPPASGEKAAADLSSLTVRAHRDTQYHPVNDRSIRILAGDALVEAKKPGLIVTPMSMTYMKSGSIALFRVRTGLERVMNLWDTKSDGVIVIARNSAVRLKPGDEVVVTDHKPYYREIHQSDNIGRRNVHRLFIGDGLFVTVDEVSLLHVAQQSGLLNPAIRSDRLVGDKILKAAAILDWLNGNKAPFSLPLPLDPGRFEPGDPLGSFEDLVPPVENRSIKPGGSR